MNPGRKTINATFPKLVQGVFGLGVPCSFFGIKGRAHFFGEYRTEKDKKQFWGPNYPPKGVQFRKYRKGSKTLA